MAQSKSTYYQTLAGLAVLGLIALAATTLFLFRRGAFAASPQTVKVAFALNPGVRGLTESAPVQMGGLKVGVVESLEVTAVAFDDNLGVAVPPATAEQRVEPMVIAVLRLDRLDAPLLRNAEIIVNSNPLGGGGVIDIRSAGRAARDPRTGAVLDAEKSRPLREGEILISRQATNVLIDDAVRGFGFGPTETDRLRRVLANAEVISEQLRRRLDEKSPDGDIAAAFRNLRRLTDPDPQVSRLAAVLAALDGQLGEKGDAAVALTRLRRFAENLEALDLKARADNADKLVTEARTALADLKPQAAALAVKLDGAVGQAGEAARKVNEVITANQNAVGTLLQRGGEAVDKVGPVLTKAGDALVRAEATLQNVERATAAARDFASFNKPALDAAVRDFRTAAADLRTTVAGIKSSPWRLLLFNYDEKLLANANVLDAARSFNSGSEAVDQTLARIQAILDNRRRDGPPVPDELNAELVRIRDQLRRLQRANAELEGELYRKVK